MRPRDEAKVQALHEQAIEMIARDGLEGFSINRLAKAAGVSPATIYIYHRDKDDLIASVSVAMGRQMAEAAVHGVEAAHSFEDSLWLQWQNRVRYTLKHPRSHAFFEQLRHSAYHERMTQVISDVFRTHTGPHLLAAMRRGEIESMPLEVFWSLAFAPLYSLVRFHNNGESIGGHTFKLSDRVLKTAFRLVLKALKK